MAIVTVLSLLAGTIAGVHLLTGWGRAPAAADGKPVPVRVVRGRKVQIPAMNSWHRKRTAWPTAGTAAAVITAVTAPSRKSRMAAGPSVGSGRAGSLPVWVGPPDTRSSRPAKRTLTAAYLSSASASAPVSRVSVAMAPQTAASALGVHGVLFTVARADGKTSSGRVHVSLDYSSFADAYGGDFASRLRLVELPSCALTTPQIARCRKQTVPRSVDDSRTGRVGTDATLPGLATSTTSARLNVRGGVISAVLTSARSSSGPGSPALVFAALAAPSGSGGNYAVEPLSEADAWVAGGSSGAFTYSYPVQVPPVPGGLVPKVSLDYDAQAVDGLTSSTNNEASWVGDGWDYSPGYIEVDYPVCSTQVLLINTSDLCKNVNGNQMSLSFNGVTTPLVQGKNGYRFETDGGATVKQSGSAWEIIEPDGTQYYFGLNQLPGFASGDPTTNSQWTVPVYEGCGSATFCNQPWRYMLDYVVDPHGNAMAYFYNTQTNYYAEDNGTTGSASYIQGGTLAKIEYGLRAGAVYGTTPRPR